VPCAWVQGLDKGQSNAPPARKFIHLSQSAKLFLEDSADVWSLAAFLMERLAPTETEGATKRKTKRDASGARPTEEGRGRQAESPSEIPAKGWKDILFRVYSNHRILALAAGMTYYSLLAIFPALAALVAIYGLSADTDIIAKHLDQVSGFIPSGALDVAREQLTLVASKGNKTLGLTSVIGLAISL
jgi:membrane protein